MNVFPDELTFANAGYVKGVRLFRLKERFRYIGSLGTIEVPKNFVTDGASIPKAFHNVLGPFGPYFEAAVIHDWGYSSLNDTFTRKQVDLIFKEAMFNAGIGWGTRETIYRAVRLFAAHKFRGNANAD